MPFTKWETPKPSRTPVNVVTVRKLYITFPADNGHIAKGETVDILYDTDAQKIAIKKDGANREVKPPSSQNEKRLRVYAKQFIETLNIPTGRYPFGFDEQLNALVFSYAPETPETE